MSELRVKLHPPIAENARILDTDYASRENVSLYMSGPMQTIDFDGPSSIL